MRERYKALGAALAGAALFAAIQTQKLEAQAPSIASGSPFGQLAILNSLPLTGLGPMATWAVAGNNTGSTSNASALGISAALDMAELASAGANAQGEILQRSAGGVWRALKPTAVNTYLQSNGVGADVSFGTVNMGGGVNGVLSGANGGTGVANSGLTITLGNNFVTNGGFSVTLNTSGTTVSALPAGTHTLAGLDVAQTWSANQTFNDTRLLLAGSTSGTLNLRSAAVSGTSSIRFPNGSTDFTLTGGANQVLQQSSAGGALTVGQLACGSLSNSGTACQAATGTSGHTVPFLDGANTWSGNQTFNSGNFLLAGLTSGTLTMKPAAVAGANTITWPAGTTDFSATGGGSQVVRQNTLGGAFTVSSLACNDLSSGAFGCSAAAATQADQETGTSTATIVTPGRQHFHQSAAKAWVYWTMSGTVLTQQQAYNASIARTGVGTYTITYTNAFTSSTSYALVCTGGQPGVTFGFVQTQSAGRAAGSTAIAAADRTGTAADLTEGNCVAYGDMP